MRNDIPIELKKTAIKRRVQKTKFIFLVVKETLIHADSKFHEEQLVHF